MARVIATLDDADFLFTQPIHVDAATPAASRAKALCSLLQSATAVARILDAPPAVRTALWLGHSASACPWIIGALSIPVFATTLIAFRRSAPTRLSLAGFTAGLLSGTVAAFVYALCCHETEPAFVVTWYTLGMLLPALVGAIVGPRLLRW